MYTNVRVLLLLLLARACVCTFPLLIPTLIPDGILLTTLTIYNGIDIRIFFVLVRERGRERFETRNDETVRPIGEQNVEGKRWTEEEESGRTSSAQRPVGGVTRRKRDVDEDTYGHEYDRVQERK